MNIFILDSDIDLCARYQSHGLTPFAQAMPVKYKVKGDAVLSYRQFYIGEKLSFARWTKRAIPPWVYKKEYSL